jgi:GNAT superfamily N-acetyltransferase
MAFTSRARRSCGTLWVMHLDWPMPDRVVPLVPATFVGVGPEATFMLAHTMGLEGPSEVQRRFATRRRCYAAMVEGNLAAYGWVTFDEERIGEMGVYIHLVPGEAYIWDCVTAPPYRQCGLYTALLAHIVDELRREGLCRIWIGADGDNLPSQKGMARVGFQPVVDLIAARLAANRPIRMHGRPGIPKQIVIDARGALSDDRSSARYSGRPFSDNAVSANSVFTQ